ncbi:MAG: preprotein translocase subunit SecE [Patescibacteria group bacterium]
MISYFRSVLAEGKKVVWPNRQTIIRHTAMVTISVIVAAVVFAGVDYGFQQLVLASLAR